MVPNGKKCGQMEWTDGHSQNYIPPTLSRDNKGSKDIASTIQMFCMKHGTPLI